MTFGPAYDVLAKPTGPICNLDCEYRFFLSKEMRYPGDRFRMADEMLEAHTMRIMGELLRQNRAPSELPAVLAACDAGA